MPRPRATAPPVTEDTRDPKTAAGTMLTNALEYGARGWPVLPLRGKRPAIAKRHGGRGVHDATTDEATIRTWWEKNPDANIGIATGADSGLIVLDVDGPEGEATMHKIVAEHGPLPDTPAVQTSRGAHYYFKHPNGRVRNFTGRLAGLDIKGDGGYIVAPPSRHPKTQSQYQWAGKYRPDCVPVAEPPTWLLELIQDPLRERSSVDGEAVNRQSAYGEAALECELVTLSSTSTGQRNCALNRAAFSLGQLVAAGALNQHCVETALKAAAASIGLSDEEIQPTISSGLKAGLLMPRSTTTTNSVADTAAIVLHPGDPLTSARAFLQRHYSRDGTVLLHHHAGNFFAWSGTHYPEADIAAIRAELYRLLDGAVWCV